MKDLNKKIVVLLSFIMFSGLFFHSYAWEKKQARIMTPWSEDIDPENVWQEYPRPQMERGNWFNMNGLWDFAKAKGMEYTKNESFRNQILVPFPMESALSGIMDTNHEANKGKPFVYRRNFTIPKEMKGKNILLHFGAVDWLCKVYINGKLAGEHKGGFDPFYFDITKHLKSSGKQEIQVYVQDYQEFGGYPHGKQKIGEKVIWYTPATGIWQTVWVEAVNPVHIDRLLITPDVDQSKINIKVSSANATASTKATIKIYDGKKLIETRNNVPVGEVCSISLNAPKLWSPNSPFLYDMQISLEDNGKVQDEVKSYFGMRKISLGQFMGMPCMLLNNEYLFQHGVLDQGYWPDGVYLAPSDEAMVYDLIKTKEFGMNMTRKHIKVEPARWYYHCDRLGLLVWQDLPNPGFGENDKILIDGADIRENFHRESTNIIRSLENYPSIIQWIVYNESWGQPNETITRQSVDVVKGVDDTRLISAASGWNDTEYGDIKDTHWYPEPNVLPNPVNKRASVCGEYGGITLQIPGHQWIGGSEMTYTRVADSDELKERFISFLRQINDLKTKGICAAVYTQITDVEDEENGLITYDRKVEKVKPSHIADIKAAIEFNYTHSPLLMPVDNNWKYYTSNTELASDAWKNVAFNDQEWRDGKAGFGSGDQPKDIDAKTKWESEYIYLRKMVDFSQLRPSDIVDLEAMIFHDEDCEVYINGVKAVSAAGYVTKYTAQRISGAAKAAIKLNEPNLIAIKCRQTTGGQFIHLSGFLTRVENAVHPNK